MTTQQIAQTLISGRRMVGGWLIGFTLLALVVLLVAGWQTMPAPARQAAAQPNVGHAMSVTGLVFDGTRYVSAPITMGVNLAQPVVGRTITVTGLVFDGTRYASAPIPIGAPRAGRGYAVTALVYDGTTYRSAPVQVGRY
jgi:hypothetical protein